MITAAEGNSNINCSSHVKLCKPDANILACAAENLGEVGQPLSYNSVAHLLWNFTRGCDYKMNYENVQKLFTTLISCANRFSSRP